MHLDLQQLRKEWKQFHSESEKLSLKILSLIELVKMRMEHGHNYDWHYHYIASKMNIGVRSLYRWKAQYLSMNCFFKCGTNFENLVSHC